MRRLLITGLILAGGIGLLPRPSLALTPEERAFADYLIGKLGYVDTASRWLDALEKKKSDEASLSDIASYRIDILKKEEGKDAEVVRAIEAFKRRYPGHLRASLGTLEVIGVEWAKVAPALEQAAIAPPEERQKRFADAIALFQEKVAKPLEGLIAGQLASYQAAVKANPPKPGADESEVVIIALRTLTQSELARLNMILYCAQRLPPDSPARKELLERGLSLADAFVDQRYEFPVMQYQGQLNRGLYAYELGRSALAADHLSILYNVEPVGSRPYQQALIDAFRMLRMQGILFGTRSENASGRFAQAREVIEKYVLGGPPDDFNLSKATDDPALATLAQLAQLEYGVALAGSGEAEKGLGVIQKVIAKQANAALVTDARKALGRISTIEGVRLSGRDYYQAAIGLKSDGRFEEALDGFQKALSSINYFDPKERNEVAPLCLNEIGEVNYIVGRYTESTLAYEEACRRFANAQPQHAILTKVATNFLAAVTKALATPERQKHGAALEKLKASAVKYSQTLGGGFALYDTALIDAQRLEEEGKYEQARQAYITVEPEHKGEAYPRYWRAQAGAWRCVYLAWDAAPAEKKPALEQDLEKAIAALGEILPKALEKKDMDGAAIASLTLGQIHYERRQPAEAAKALAPFATLLAGNRLYGCAGLGTLILAETEAGSCDEATAHFETLSANCEAEPVVSQAALVLAGCYDSAGDWEQAATFTLRWATHPASKSELEDPDRQVQVARRLIYGGKTAEARPWLEKLQAKPPTKEIERDIAFLEAKALAAEKLYADAIGKLKGYIEKYKPKNDQRDDAYVYWEMAEAYANLDAPKPPSQQNLKEAHDRFNAACGWMAQRYAVDPALEKTFSAWVLRFMEVKMQLGDLGDVNKYREVVNYVKTEIVAKQRAMGGLQERFIALKTQAEAKLASSGGKANE